MKKSSSDSFFGLFLLTVSLLTNHCDGVQIPDSAVPIFVPNRPACTGKGNNAFERNCIVPDLIDQAPLQTLQVEYSLNTVLDYGNELKPEQVKDRPILVTWNAVPNALYTLSKSDPDAPSRLNYSRSPINHWLVVNIPMGEILSQGDELMPYKGAGPPLGTGLHRYVFMVFQQAYRLNISDPSLQFSPQNRFKFQIRQFALAHDLGSPLAGNFYQAQYSSFLDNKTG